MKKISAVIAILLFATPALAMADPLVPTQPTMAQLLTRVAALEALESAASSTVPVSCAALSSVPSVVVNAPFVLAWGSVGALAPSASSTQSMWSQNGAQTVTQSKPGTWAYSFTFYGVSGGTATCTATVTVTS